MIVVLEFDDFDVNLINGSVKSYDIDFHDVLGEIIGLGFSALNFEIRQYRVAGERDRSLEAYRAFSVNIARWLDDTRFLSDSEPPSFYSS
jgi:hypothetical protein